MERDKELVTLDLDIEEAEVEICSLTGLEMDAVEFIRHNDIKRIEKNIHDRHRRNLRVERCKWRVRTIRPNVLRRQRENLQAAIQTAKDRRGMEYATTVTYEKKAQHWDYEELAVRRFQEDQGTKLDADLQRRYEVYGGPVQASFDAVVSNTLSLLKVAILGYQP